MAARQLSDGNDTGTILGQDASDLISLHGKTPIALASIASLASGATIATVVAWAQALQTALVNKGIIALS